jgi:cytochrome c553
VEAARQLVRQNRCEQCHGLALAGQEQVPRLAGQQADYLRDQLNGFRMAIRGDVDGRMTAAAQALSDTDIDRLADYIAALRAP